MLHILYTLIVFPVEQVIELCYIFVFRIFHSPGLSIFGVSLAVSTLVLPIYLMAEKQQRAEREKQVKMKSAVENIKAVFKGDKRHMLLATLYRQNNYHPLYSLRGSLDLFIQIPFFIAAYHFLHNLVLLKGQAFFFIKDLGTPDGLFSGINLLPLVMTLINCISGAVYSRGFPLKDKVQLYGTAAVFLVLLYNSPAGLVLYWTSNNIYNLVKNILQKTKHAGSIIAAAAFVAGVSLAVFVLFFHEGILKKRILIGTVSLLAASIPLWKKTIFSIVARLKQSKQFSGFSIKMDIKSFALSCGILFLLTGLVIPSALISSSVEEFSFIDGYVNPFLFIQNTLLQSAGIFLVWGFFLYILSDKKTKSLLSVSVLILAAVSVINTFVFKGDYGSITNLLEFSKMESPGFRISLISSVAAIVAALCVSMVFSRKFILYPLLSVTLVSCLVFGIINIAKIHNIDSASDKTMLREDITFPEPEYTFSRNGKNVLLIMLDRAFSGYVPAILEEKPELREIYSGFIFYPNTVSFGNHTLMGAPPLYGGYEYTPREINKRDTVSMLEKNNESLLLLPKLFFDTGFTVTVTDPPWANFSWIPDLSIFDNYPGIHAANVLYSQKYVSCWMADHRLERSVTAVRQVLYTDLIRFSFFRAAAPLLRKFIYDHGNYLEIQNENKLDPKTLYAYAAMDILPKITGITGEGNTYNAVYNELPHRPEFFQFPTYDAAEEISNLGNGIFSREKHYHANIASWLLLAQWFEYLKENGVYDNTRIIITSDHGVPDNIRDTKMYNYVLPNGEYLNGYTPLLLFKDFNADGALRTDNVFMTNADVPLLALEGLVDNPVNPFTGNALTADKTNGAVITSSHLWNPWQNGKFRFTIKPHEWLHVKDNIFDMKNWNSIVIDD